MRLIQGTTLAALLKRRPSKEELPHLLAVYDQICRAMEYAHSRQVIHRDLKPANIMVSVHGDVQVIDWGLAKVLGEDGANSVLRHPLPECDKNRVGAAGTGSANEQSHTGWVMGTPPYMAPEQAQGKNNELDARCDVFSLGAILCEILTGRPPYVGGDLLSRAKAADLTDSLVSLDRCGADERLVYLAMICLSSNASYRPQNAGEVARQVRECLDALNRSPQKDGEEKLKAAERRLKTAHRWLTGAAVALLITFNLLLWIGLFRFMPTANSAPAVTAFANQTGGSTARAAPGYTSASGQQEDRRGKETLVPFAASATRPQPNYSWPNGSSAPYGSRFGQTDTFALRSASPFNTPSWLYAPPLYAGTFNPQSWQYDTNPFHWRSAGFGATAPGFPPGSFPGGPGPLNYLDYLEHARPLTTMDAIPAPGMNPLLNATRHSESLRSVESLMSSPLVRPSVGRPLLPAVPRFIKWSRVLRIP